MNPLKLLRIATRANRVLTLLQQASASSEKGGSMSKSLFKSKIFWVNLLTAGSELSGVLTGVLPAGTLTLIASVLNIALRMVTTSPVHVLK